MVEVQIIVATAVIGLFIGIFFYIVKIFKKESVSEDSEVLKAEEDLPASNSKVATKKNENSQKKGNNKHSNKEKATFSHKWLVASLKGHCDVVTSMDLSSNGKYL